MDSMQLRNVSNFRMYEVKMNRISQMATAERPGWFCYDVYCSLCELVCEGEEEGFSLLLTPLMVVSTATPERVAQSRLYKSWKKSSSCGRDICRHWKAVLITGTHKSHIPVPGYASWMQRGGINFSFSNHWSVGSLSPKLFLGGQPFPRSRLKLMLLYLLD